MGDSRKIKHLKDEELQALWQFYDKDKNNALTKDEIGQLLERLRKKEGVESPLPDEFVTSVFNLVDKNGDGKVDWDEFKNHFNDFWVNRASWFAQVKHQNAMDANPALPTLPPLPPSFSASSAPPAFPSVVPPNSPPSAFPVPLANAFAVPQSGRAGGGGALLTKRLANSSSTTSLGVPESNRTRGKSLSMMAPKIMSASPTPRHRTESTTTTSNNFPQRGGGETAKADKTAEDAGKTDTVNAQMLNGVFVKDPKYLKPELHTKEIYDKLSERLKDENFGGTKYTSDPMKCPHCQKPIDMSIIEAHLNRSKTGVPSWNGPTGGKVSIGKNADASYSVMAGVGGDQNVAYNRAGRGMPVQSNVANGILMKGKVWGYIPVSFFNSPYNTHTWYLR